MTAPTATSEVSVPRDAAQLIARAKAAERVMRNADRPITADCIRDMIAYIEALAAAPRPSASEFESINRIEAMRNRLAAGETTFTLDELKLTLAWADHLNYFLASYKRIAAEKPPSVSDSEIEEIRKHHEHVERHRDEYPLINGSPVHEHRGVLLDKYDRMAERAAAMEAELERLKTAVRVLANTAQGYISSDVSEREVDVALEQARRALGETP